MKIVQIVVIAKNMNNVIIIENLIISYSVKIMCSAPIVVNVVIV